MIDDQTRKKGNNGFISFSHYLRKKQQDQIKTLEKLDYNYIGHKETNQLQTQMFVLMKNKGKNQLQKKHENTVNDFNKKNNHKRKTVKTRTGYKNNPISNANIHSSEQKQYGQIDSQAVVMNNKLIYLKEQASSAPSNDHLLHLLKQNSLSNKDYLLGKKKQILDQITQNQSEKENQIIKDYILRNMNEQNNGEVIIMDRFHQIKHQLFS